MPVSVRGVLGAIHRLDHKGLDLGLAFAQVLHLAVVDVVGPGATFGDGEAAQCTRTRGAIASQELGLVGAVHVGHAQGTGLGQGRVGFIFGDRTSVATGDHRRIVDAGDGDGDGVLGAIHGLDHKGLDLGLAFAQVLHLAVVNVVGPGATFGDGQAAQCASAGHAVAGHKLGLVGAVHVGHAQGAGLGQSRVGLVFGDRTSITTGDHRGIVDAGDGDGDGVLGAIHGLDHKGLDLGLAFAQVLHLAVVDVVGPGSAFGNGQATQCASAGHAVAGHKLGLVGAVHVGHAQGTGLGQSRGAFIFGDRTSVTTGDHRRIVDAGDGDGDGVLGAID